MCTLLATNVHRDAFIVSYVAEPKLAIAAAMVWNLQRNMCEHILPALQRSLAAGLLGQGLRGELVGQIIILLAFDAACSDHNLYPGSAVPLLDVLKQLTPIDTTVDVKEAVPEALWSSKVDYNFVNDHLPCFVHTFAFLV